MSGTFDRVVSIEMLEAVGEAYWPTYFRTCEIAYVQAASPCCRLLRSMRFVSSLIVSLAGLHSEIYLFPGGMLPTKTSNIVKAARIAAADLTLLSAELFGESYAQKQNKRSGSGVFRRRGPLSNALDSTTGSRRLGSTTSAIARPASK